MVNKKILLIMVIALIALVSSVTAETLTGEIGSAGFTSYNYWSNHTSSQSAGGWTVLTVVNIQNTAGVDSYVHFDQASYLPSYGNATNMGSSTSFTASIGGTEIGYGTFGFQRLFAGAVEQPGYQYLIFENWTPGSYTGTQTVTLTWNSTLLHQTFSSGEVGPITGGPSGYMSFRAFDAPISGSHTLNYDVTLLNEYSATFPELLGINGYVLKNVSGTTYPSKVHIINGVTGAGISSESTVTSTQFNFTCVPQPIIIAVQGPTGLWYNSTLLFSPGPGETTTVPTITPTSVPTIPAGYVRSTVHVWDRSGNHINSANIQILDVDGSTWSNATHDADGVHYIDTLPYHTLNAYADFDVFENEFLPGSTLGFKTGYTGGVFYVTLYPYESGATAGNVTMYVEVKDADTGSYVPYAVVSLTVTTTGITYSQSTANHGSAIFVVPNDTVVYATARAAGYLSQTEFANSGDDGSEAIVIELVREAVTVAPTSTIPPGGVTPVVTVDPRTSNQKDEDMMELIRNNGPNLINLAIAATVLSLMGLMMKGLKW